MSRPTPERIAEARDHFDRLLHYSALSLEDISHARVLLDATEPPTGEEIIAVHNRQRGLWTEIAIKTVRHFFGSVKP
jgi:hypothetical protein